jgi:hypothetical protein
LLYPPALKKFSQNSLACVKLLHTKSQSSSLHLAAKTMVSKEIYDTFPFSAPLLSGFLQKFGIQLAKTFISYSTFFTNIANFKGWHKIAKIGGNLLPLYILMVKVASHCGTELALPSVA